MKRALFAVAVLLFPIPAAAQESGQAGLAIGFPGSIGIIWHASGAVAVRPDFSFSRTESESGLPSGLETSSWALGVAASALFYTGKVRDDVRTYFSPRFGYTRTTVDSNPTVASLTSGSHANSYQYSGSFGVQYSPTRRFSVYGEAGLAYARSESTFTSTSTVPGFSASGRTTSSSFGTRAGIGAVLYFN
jgi:opacity protein-like surface antigen